MKNRIEGVMTWLKKLLDLDKISDLLDKLCTPVGTVTSRRPEPYYGRLIGRLTQYAHGIRGTVYAVDESTVYVRGFAYDGTGPDAYFWVGDTPQPSPEGILVPYPEDYTSRDPPILTAHSNSDILLKLPGGKRLRDIKWISVWCRRFTVNFGDVFIPPGLDPPRPRVLPEFKRLAHGLRSGNISVLDAKTFYIPNLHYDGAGPDAYFWVGNGSEPNPFGTKVPNEMGSLHPLRGYQGEDIEIQLPGKLTAYDIDWLAVWCVEYRHNFGHVYIPKDLDVPPALGQTKITTSSTTSQSPFSATNNCKEILDKRLQVRWEIQGDQVQITLSARLRKEQYMAFGISGAEGRPAMLGADVVVAYWDTRVNQPRVSDYSISHLAQCDGERGVCPDQRIGGTNDAQLVSGNQKNGITTITYRRPLAAKETMKDKEILTSRSQSVIAAFGPLNSRYEANAHSFMDTTRNDVQLDFGAQNENTCIGLAETDSMGPAPWAARVVAGAHNLTARIGPAGGARGYTPLTGTYYCCIHISPHREHVPRPGGDGLYGAGAVGGARGGGRAQPHRAHRARRRRQGVHAPHRYVLLLHTHIPAQRTRAEAWRGRTLWGRRRGRRAWWRARTTSPRASGPPAAPGGTRPSPVRTTAAYTYPRTENTCRGLAGTDSMGPAPWAARVVAGAHNLTARIGPAGGARGYTPLTGTYYCCIHISPHREHVPRPGGDGLYGAGAVGGARGGGRAQPHRAHRARRRRQGVHAPHRYVLLLHTHIPAQRTRAEAWRGRTLWGRRRGRRAWWRARTTSPRASGPPAAPGGTRPSPVRTTAAYTYPRTENTCRGLAGTDSMGPAPWAARVVAGAHNLTARIGPAGGARGYTPLTGTYYCCIHISPHREHVPRPGGDGLYGAGAVGGARGGGRAQPHRAHRARRRRQGVHAPHRYVLLLHTHIPAQRTRAEAWRGRTLWGRRRGRRAWWRARTTSPRASGPPAAPGGTRPSPVRTTAAYTYPRTENTCRGLAGTDSMGPAPWAARVVAGAHNLTARIGPAGGARGYTPLTGTYYCCIHISPHREHVPRPGGDGLYGAGAVGGARGGGRAQPHRAHRARRRRQGVHAPHRYVLLLHTHIPAQRTRAEAWRGRTLWGRRRGRRAWWRARTTSPRASGPPAAPGGTRPSPVRTTAAYTYPRTENTCRGLAGTDSMGPAPWAARVVAGAHNLTARIGPAGGARGYTPLTGTYYCCIHISPHREHVPRPGGDGLYGAGAVGGARGGGRAQPHRAHRARRRRQGVHAPHRYVLLLHTHIPAQRTRAEAWRGRTRHPSWGIAWYINDQLIPEIYVERGKTYTFMVEGGDDRTNPAKFHPFYISDSSEGGFGQKKEEDQRKQRVFAGVAYDNEGYPYPTAVGRYCEWTHKTIDQSATSETFEEYMNTLQLECNEGEPAVLNWTVAHETPDLLYYQCYTHNNLGWKIHVVDPGTPVPLSGDKQGRVNAAAAPALSALAPLAFAAARHLANRGR
uniref:DM13 domain-containing protein n=1 Tax=Heliothis virescens TaxID=7102 RepID=A0A2A4J7G6_HELVI